MLGKKKTSSRGEKERSNEKRLSSILYVTSFQFIGIYTMEDINIQSESGNNDTPTFLLALHIYSENERGPSGFQKRRMLEEQKKA